MSFDFIGNKYHSCLEKYSNHEDWIIINSRKRKLPNRKTAMSKEMESSS